MKSRPKYWRSIAELEGDSEFQEYVQREFRSPTEQTELSSGGRRRFMQLMGASFALSGCRWPEEKLLPHASRDDGAIPGVPRHFATTMDISGVATGLLVKSYDGRPIKVEGNPTDPQSKGGTGTYHQAAILGLYDPDRSSQVLEGKTPSTWKKYQAALLAAVASAQAKGGSGFAVLSQASSSPSLVRLKKTLAQRLPGATWVGYEATYSRGPAEGAKLAFGEEVAQVYHPENADIILSLDSDLLSVAAPGGIGYSRAVASRRDPDQGTMSRIYAFEAGLSELGSLADHRVTVRPTAITAIAAYVDAKLSQGLGISGAQAVPAVASIGGEGVQKVLDVAIRDLLEHKGKTLVTAGRHHSPDVHALVHRINATLGNESTISYSKAHGSIMGGVDELAALVADIEAGKVESLLIIGANPAYDAPADVDFSAALRKVKSSFHLGLYVDETASLCSWHAPEAHFLETWGDARAADGSVRLAQPLIDPLLGGKSALEVLATALGLAVTDPQKQVRQTNKLDDEKAWKRAAVPSLQRKARAAPPSMISAWAICTGGCMTGLLAVVVTRA